MDRAVDQQLLQEDVWGHECRSGNGSIGNKEVLSFA